VTRETEDATERDRRRYQRELFDGVARLYEATRPGYPPELTGFVAATAGARPEATVLEVGCGTGQLTGVENTRATSLSWPDDERQAFTAELSQLLSGQAEVGLTLEAKVTMARVRRPASGG
jgi:hypothetical protein